MALEDDLKTAAAAGVKAKEDVLAAINTGVATITTETATIKDLLAKIGTPGVDPAVVTQAIADMTASNAAIEAAAATMNTAASPPPPQPGS